MAFACTPASPVHRPAKCLPASPSFPFLYVGNIYSCDPGSTNLISHVSKIRVRGRCLRRRPLHLRLTDPVKVLHERREGSRVEDKKRRCSLEDDSSGRRNRLRGPTRRNTRVTKCHALPAICNMCTESPSISLSYYTSALRRHRVASHPRFIFDRGRFPPLLGIAVSRKFLRRNLTRKKRLSSEN